MSLEKLAAVQLVVGELVEPRFDDAISEESAARTLSGEDLQVVRSREEALRKSLAAQGALSSARRERKSH